MSRAPVAAVGIVCLKGDEVLLIRRGKPPREGEWSLPGGRIEWGERARDAALRELKEETGVEAEIFGLIDVVDGLFASRATGEKWGHYVLVDFAARWISGEAQAGDDAAEARFVRIAEIGALAMWEETERVIKAAAALARVRG
ncbi:MAG: NUDIX hydrolase [Hyphomonadaceae bacterium]